MIRNYFIIAWRNFLRNKSQSAINIAGLAFGFTCFILIALYIFDELTYDRFYSRADQIYRVVEHQTAQDGVVSKSGTVAYNIGEGALSHLPEVEKSGRLLELGRANIENEALEKKIHGDLVIASKNFLEILDFPLLAGNRNTALQKPFSVVISREFALFLFDTDDVLGKLIQVERWETPFEVTGIIEKIPHNSSLQFDALFSEASLEVNPAYNNDVQSDWISSNFLTFFLLKDKAKVDDIQSKVNSLVANHRKSDDAKGEFSLQPISDIHFYSEGINNSYSRQGDIKYIYIFGAVALFILLIACINYMNLATAYASLRAKEVGVRKVSGAQAKDLKLQFLSESFLITVLSSLFALLIVQLLLPYFNAFTEKELSLNLLSDLKIWIIITVVVLFTALLSGTYPAFILSRINPYLLVKNLKTSNFGNLELRKGLVIFQFVLSFVMIALTLAISFQINYIRKKDLGFKQEQLVVVDINSGAVRQGFQTIKNEYLKLADVKNVSVTSRVPGEWKWIPEISFCLVENEIEGNGYYIAADEDFLSTYDIKLIAGRNFNQERLEDSLAVILNESAAKLLGITVPTEQLLDLPSQLGQAITLEKPQRVKVIGIVSDFNFHSLHQKIAPMVIGYRKNPLHSIDYFTVQMAGSDVQQTLNGLEKILRDIDPGHLFEYHFLDQQLQLFYIEDAKRYTIFTAAAMATIFIASLGLFGLAAFSAQQRTKEIGIRKVLGASEMGIISLLTRDFLRLILISIIIGTPIAWYMVTRWLESFAYRIEVQWCLFVGAGCLAIFVAVITISFQSFRAASGNVIQNLRSE